MLRSLYATFSFTLFLSILPNISFISGDMIMSSLCGGVMTGAGLGLVLNTLSSTGGTDLLSVILRHYFGGYSVSTILLYIDGLIVMTGAAVFGIRNAVYALLAVFVSSRVMDAVVNGIRYSKLILIISEMYEPISELIMLQLNRGVTLVNATGMYSGRDRNMLLCAVSKRQTVNVVKIVSRIDKNAFIMISDVKEIFGEGFEGTGDYIS